MGGYSVFFVVSIFTTGFSLLSNKLFSSVYSVDFALFPLLLSNHNRDAAQLNVDVPDQNGDCSHHNKGVSNHNRDVPDHNRDVSNHNRDIPDHNVDVADHNRVVTYSTRRHEVFESGQFLRRRDGAAECIVPESAGEGGSAEDGECQA